MIYENADTKSINKTIVDVAGEYKVSVIVNEIKRTINLCG